MNETGQKGISSLRNFRKSELRELRKFSYALVLLKLIPAFIVLVFALLAGQRIWGLSTEASMLVVLAALLAVYFFLPKMVSKIIEAVSLRREIIMSKRKAV